MIFPAFIGYMLRCWLPAVIFAWVWVFPAAGQEVILYSGRSQALVQPLVDNFERETGIRVRVRYGGTPQLALALQQEGRRSRADLFWAQDAAALGSVAEWLQPLPESLLREVDPSARDPQGLWVGTSGRVRVLAYSSARVEPAALPGTLDELAGEAWRGRVGWAPTNSSFQTFVTALRLAVGDSATRDWLLALKANGAQAYPNNSSLLQGLAAGEIDLALTNHYYLYRMLQRDPAFPVQQVFFAAGSAGNLVNYAAIGQLRGSRNPAAAQRLMAYLVSHSGQEYFVNEIFEYPVKDGVNGLDGMLDFAALQAQGPDMEAGQIGDLQGTIRLLREVGLL